MYWTYFRYLFICIIPVGISAQNGVPVIEQFNLSADWAGHTLTLNYDVSDPENDPLEVTVEFSNTAGKTYGLGGQVAMSGDIGFPVTPGQGRAINCDISALAGQGAAFTVRLVVDDRQAFDLQSLVNKVDSNRLRGDLQFMEGIRHRTSGPVHLAEARDSLEQLFSNLGLFTEEQIFTYNTSYSGRNVFGTAAGISAADTVVVVDAHYDTVSNAPGADDNGSGTVGVMELARLMSRYPTRKSLRFIGFDLEEAGLIGSYNYVATGIPANEEVAGVFNFEMIGYYSEAPNSQTLPPGFSIIFPAASAEVAANQYRGDFITNVGNAKYAALANLFSTSAAAYVPDLKVITVLEPTGLFVPDLRRSDHAPFWDKGIPALMLTDGSEYRNKCYHTPSDTLDDKLNFTFMARVVKATLAAAAQLAEIRHGDWATASFEGIVPSVEPVAACPRAVVYGSNSLRLQFDACPLSGLTLELFSTGGVLCHREIFLNPPDNGWYEWALPDLACGIYILKIQAAEGSRTFKVFKS